MASGTRSQTRSAAHSQGAAPLGSPRGGRQSGAFPSNLMDDGQVFGALEQAVAEWMSSKASLHDTKKEIEKREKQRQEDLQRQERDKLRQEKERQQREAAAHAEEQRKREREDQERQRKQRSLEAENRAKAMSTPSSSYKEYSHTGSVYYAPSSGMAPSVYTAPTSRTQAPPTKTVKIYWDISKEDERVADTIRLLMSKLKPRPERYIKGTQLPTRGAVLFGFVWIVSRADIGDEDATTLWQNQGAYTALTVCYANPGNEAFLRPPNYVGLREGMIHFSRGQHGDLIRASWILSGAKPEFESDEDAENRGRRIGVEVLGEGKLLRKLQGLADQAAV